MKISTTRILLILLVIASLLRFYRIDSPIADWHSWRQADTAAVTRNFTTFGFNPFIPRYDDLSNIQTGVDNPEGYRFVEFPLYQSIVYVLSSVFTFVPVSLELWHRLVSVIFSLGTIFLIYRIGMQLKLQRVGLIAAGLYALLPYAVFYSRSILPESLLVFLILCSLSLFLSYINSRSIWYLIASAVTAALGLLVKPTALLFYLPIAAVWYQSKLFTRQEFVRAIAYSVLVIVPLLGWRVWMQNFPEGIPAWEWLLNDHVLSDSSIASVLEFLFGYQEGGIRYRPAFFYWIGWKRITALILGYGSAVFVFLGIIRLFILPRHRLVLGSFVMSAILYGIVFAKGNVQHDYYQIVLLPMLVLLASYGMDFIVQRVTLPRRPYAVACCAVLLAISLYVSWQTVKTYYWINNSAIISAGDAADSLLPPDAKVIAPYGGDTAFLYQTKRQGWPVGFDIEEKIQKGATHYVTVTPDDAEVSYVREKWTLIEETEDYALFKLQ